VRTSLECLGCMINQAIRAAQVTSGDRDVQQRIVRHALAETVHVDFASQPVTAGRRVQRLVRRLTGNHDPYRGLKQRSTALALRLLPELRRKVLASPMPIGAALSVATAANALDFAMYADLDERAVRRALAHAAAQPIDGALALAAEAATAREILYIADNAGELVFDGLVIDLLDRARVTLAVRGGPIFNDATLHDARVSRLTDTVLVIDTGSDLAGVVLDECSDDFRRHFASADLVIAKGQGNYETLDDVEGPIWFALKVKCPVIARAIGVAEGQCVLRRQTIRAGSRDLGRIPRRATPVSLVPEP
jgi:damage-control phosphatase, subfamily I